MIARGRRSRRLARAIACSTLEGSILKVSIRESTKTGVAPSHATTSAVAANVNDGTNTASPGPTSLAISTMAIASVPFAQAIVCVAPQKADRWVSRDVDLRPHDVTAMIKNAGDRCVNIGANGPLLRRQIDESDGFAFEISHDGIGSRMSAPIQPIAKALSRAYQIRTKLLARPAHPSHAPRRHANHQSIGRHLRGDDCARG